MLYAIKRRGKRVRAYELGKHGEMERALLEEGAIRRDAAGNYRLFSLEAVNGAGEIARPGDFFKVDEVEGVRYPYPNARSWFLDRHRHIAGDEYEQRCVPLAVWTADAPIFEEIAFLLQTGKLRITPRNEDRYFHAWLWGAPLSAAMDAVLVIYEVKRDANGAISDIDFGFVDRQVFERDYMFCDAFGHPIRKAAASGKVSGNREKTGD